MKNKRYYTNLLKLMYIFKYKIRDRGNLSRTNKAYYKAIKKFREEGRLELTKIKK
jgi:hypothetical protein